MKNKNPKAPRLPLLNDKIIIPLFENIVKNYLSIFLTVGTETKVKNLLIEKLNIKKPKKKFSLATDSLDIIFFCNITFNKDEIEEYGFFPGTVLWVGINPKPSETAGHGDYGNKNESFIFFSLNPEVFKILSDKQTDVLFSSKNRNNLKGYLDLVYPYFRLMLIELYIKLLHEFTHFLQARTTKHITIQKTYEELKKTYPENADIVVPQGGSAQEIYFLHPFEQKTLVLSNVQIAKSEIQLKNIKKNEEEKFIRDLLGAEDIDLPNDKKSRIKFFKVLKKADREKWKKAVSDFIVIYERYDELFPKEIIDIIDKYCKKFIS